MIVFVNRLCQLCYTFKTVLKQKLKNPVTLLTVESGQKLGEI